MLQCSRRLSKSCSRFFWEKTCDAILLVVCDFSGLGVLSVNVILIDLCESGPVGLGCQQGATQGSSGSKSVCCFNVGVSVKMCFCLGVKVFKPPGVYFGWVCL